MDEEPTKDLATRAFQKRVLDEFAAVRRDITELRSQQTAMAKNIAELDQRVASIDERVTSIDQRLIALEEKVDKRLQETRPIWEAVQEQLQRLVEKFDAVLLDFSELRGEMKIHGRRIGELERRVLS